MRIFAFNFSANKIIYYHKEQYFYTDLFYHKEYQSI